MKFYRIVLDLETCCWVC